MKPFVSATCGQARQALLILSSLEPKPWKASTVGVGPWRRSRVGRGRGSCGAVLVLDRPRVGAGPHGEAGAGGALRDGRLGGARGPSVRNRGRRGGGVTAGGTGQQQDSTETQGAKSQRHRVGNPRRERGRSVPRRCSRRIAGAVPEGLGGRGARGGAEEQGGEREGEAGVVHGGEGARLPRAGSHFPVEHSAASASARSGKRVASSCFTSATAASLPWWAWIWQRAVRARGSSGASWSASR